MKQVHFEVTKEGQLKGEALLLKALKQKPGKYRAEIYQEGKRTNQQNRYMHMVFSRMKAGFYNAGWEDVTTPDKAKAECKKLFLSYEMVNRKTGEVKPAVKGTSEMTKEECSHFIDMIIQYAAEFLGIVIPTPEEYYADKTKWDLTTLAA
jgi:thioredoxin-related protein